MLAFGPCLFTLGVALLSLDAVQMFPSVANKSKQQILPTDDPTLENITTEMFIIANYSNNNKSNSEMSNSSMSYANTTTAVTTWTEQKDTESDATTPNPMTTTIHSLSTEMRDNLKDKRLVTTAKPDSKKTDNTGIIILILIIVIAIGFALACYIVRRRGRHSSVDLSPVMGPDEANIPLSTLEPELPIDSAPQNGLQTFQSDGKGAEEEDDNDDEVSDGQKTEAEDRQPHAESASAAPPADDSENKPKDSEKDPPAPVEPAGRDATDKTSEGTPEKTNENNSNNADASPRKD
ncbi:uncharacterized protein LOC129182452 [Dunckerocampus dactyliophorus]|uniref:uncharacterized protein LOC129182452 n=1 Tax=Dunckerocampus dactyliophorus TaxID=161453 RepID=UPI002406400D|nr:uncharacterized protein LOC129182452 [Dunckerocampus dactyliophorus]